MPSRTQSVQVAYFSTIQAICPAGESASYRQGLWARALLFGVTRLMILIVHCCGECGLLGGVAAAHSELIRHDHCKLT